MRAVLRLALAYTALCFTLALVSQGVVPRCAERTQSADIAVVLGSAIEGDGRLTPDSAARVAASVALYQRGLLDRIHMSGGGAAKDGTPIGLAMARDAVAAGVPADVVTQESESQSTLENALFSLPFLRDEDRVLVITEPFHALRGGATFLWAGRPAAVCASARGEATPLRWLREQARETAAWGLNLIRAPLWSAAQAVSLGDHLPDTFPH